MMKGPEQGFTGRYVDEMPGQILNDSLVAEARGTEMEYFTSRGVWRKRQPSKSVAKTGRRPTSAKWVDMNKGDEQQSPISVPIGSTPAQGHGSLGQVLLRADTAAGGI